MSKVGFIGLGKLGLPVALAIESKGHEVVGYDVRPEPYEYIKNKSIPFVEKDLQLLLDNTNIKMVETVEEMFDCDIIFAAPQTPHDSRFEGTTRLPKDRADFDYTFLKRTVFATSEFSGILAVISTCLPGTYEREIKQLVGKQKYVYVPQFIAMGTVLDDYLNPEFNLIGVEDEDAANLLEKFYATINGAPCVKTDITTAEGIKVSYNTWITAKTVIANAWGEMSEKLGMNFGDIKKAWDLSTKRLISPKYTNAGMSDGGGCHPRDNIALSYIANKVGMSHNIWEDLMAAREDYEVWHADLAAKTAELHDLPLVILGRAFKPETEIETGSPAILVSNILKEWGVEHIHVNDLEHYRPAVYFIATQNERYARLVFPEGSTVIDPFGFIPDQDGLEIIHIGRK